MDLPARQLTLRTSVALLVLSLACSANVFAYESANGGLSYKRAPKREASASFTPDQVEVVAVDDFDWQIPGLPDPQLGKIIAADLAASGGNFEIAESPKAAAKSASKRRVGVIRGTVAPATASGKYDIDVYLVDAKSNARIDGRRFTVKEDSFRHGAHEISDHLFWLFTDTEGVALTKVAYSGPARDQGFNLTIADSGLAQSQVVATSSKPFKSPSWSPDGGSVAYESYENNRSSIFAQDAKAGSRRWVMDTQGDAAPAWSSDGTSLAISLSSGKSSSIAVYDMETDKVEQLTAGIGLDRNPAWGIDNDTIYFDSTQAGMTQIYSVTRSKRNSMQLPLPGTHNAKPKVSADGKYLAFVSRDAGGQTALKLAELSAGTVATIVPGNVRSHGFSPNSQLVMYVVDEAGSAVVRRYSVALKRVVGEGVPGRFEEIAWGAATQK